MAKKKKNVATPSPEPPKEEPPKKKRTRKPKGFKNQGIVARGPREIGGFTLTESQKLPEQLLREHCQKKQRPRPIFKRTRSPKDTFCFRVIVRMSHTPGKEDDNVTVVTRESFPQERLAKESAALLALYALEPQRRYEMKLPEPFRSAWLALQGESATAESKNEAPVTSKKAKKAARKEALEKAKQERAQRIAAIKAKTAAKKEARLLAETTDTSSVVVETDSKSQDDETVEEKDAETKSDDVLRISAAGKFKTQKERRKHRQEAQERRKQRERKRTDIAALCAPVSLRVPSETLQLLTAVAKEGTHDTTAVAASGDESNTVHVDTVDALVKEGFVLEDVHLAAGRLGLSVCQTGAKDSDDTVDMLRDTLSLVLPPWRLPQSILKTRGEESLRKAESALTFALCCLGFPRALVLQRFRQAAGVTVHEAAAELCREMTPFLLKDHVLYNSIDDTDNDESNNIVIRADTQSAQESFGEQFSCTLRDTHVVWTLEICHKRADSNKKTRVCLYLPNVSEGATNDDTRGMPLMWLQTDALSPNECMKVTQYLILTVLADGVAGALEASESVDAFSLLCAAQALTEQLLHDTPRNQEVLSGTPLHFPTTWHVLPQLTAASAAERIASTQVESRKDRIRRIRRRKQGRKAASATSDRSEQNSDRSSHSRQPVRRRVDPQLSARMLETRKSIQQTAEWKKMKQVRDKLPIASYRREILETLEQQRVLVLCGETGCGKSTQTPQFLLEHAIDSLLGDEVHVVCAQPRRISALGLAARVAQEQCNDKSVGYAIRFERKISEATRLLYCTTGVLRNMLDALLSDSSDGYGGSFAAQSITHVVVDEVHERSVDVDVLLLQLRRLLRARTNLRVILMSATVNAKLFANYFATKDGPAPVLQVPGRTFPVEVLNLEHVLLLHRQQAELLRQHAPHYRRSALVGSGKVSSKTSQEAQEFEKAIQSFSLSKWTRTQPSLPRSFGKISMDAETAKLAAAVFARHESGHRHRVDPVLVATSVWTALASFCGVADLPGTCTPGVLVFLPGLLEIQRCRDACIKIVQPLLAQHGFSMKLVALHSSLPTATASHSAGVFARCRADEVKVVLSTNMAETSVTVPDIGVVIDTGKQREQRHDPATDSAMLVECFGSLANAKQRQGRAGRVSAGVCFRLFTSALEKRLSAQPVPEIRRVSLTHLSLQLRAMLDANKETRSLTVKQVLTQLIEPPNLEAQDAALQTLVAVDAIRIDKKEELTPLGQHMAQLPVHNIRLAKLLLLGATLSCVSPTVSLCALLSSDLSILLSPPDKRDEARTIQRRTFGISSQGIQGEDSYLDSDHLLALNAFLAFRRCWKNEGAGRARRFCEQHFLRFSALRQVELLRQRFLQALKSRSFVPRSFVLNDDFVVSGRAVDTFKNAGPKHVDAWSSDARVLLCCLAGALFPRVCVVRRPQDKYVVVSGGAVRQEGAHESWDFKFFPLAQGRFPDRVKENQTVQLSRLRPSDVYDSRVFAHPSSALRDHYRFEHSYVVYFRRMQTSKPFLFDASVVSPWSLLFFGGALQLHDMSEQETLLQVGDRLLLRAPRQLARLLRALRRQLAALLQQKLVTPSMDMTRTNTLHAIVQLLHMHGTARRCA